MAYRDPQHVQQDEQDRNPGIKENHFADYNASGDIPDTAIDIRPPIPPPSPQHVISQRSLSQTHHHTLMIAVFSHP
ncbi:uncharacterized protein F5147DRAFT_838574 [Suillus discolor]|uniref:Uncharacterized protein n=1 Tax=Suillus discolor TaxID=1912936 RepID=A0A9P7F3L8_9AGAM|nr:uncharacterized protein F5147DRAFT_838574 [Suillus discolor]KAG2103478.1 hypothetical protein F5147DRAFT_838574 [Suillus discolor]